MSLVEWIALQEHASESGTLVVAEAGPTIPFAVQRVYYLYDLKRSQSRGFHAHKKLQQLAVCIHGSCRFLLDDGVNEETVLLDRPNRGLLVRPMIWHVMSDFSSDCVLMVLANEHYDESDYIRDYGDFKHALS